MNQDDITAAAKQLARSGRGQNAMRRLLAWLDDDGLGLDQTNKECCLLLLMAAFDSSPMFARDAMREALGE